MMTSKQRRSGTGGRKPGSRNRPKIPAYQRGKELAYRALKGNDAPLSVLLEAMRFFVGEARRVAALPDMREVRVHPAAKGLGGKGIEGAKPEVEVLTAGQLYMSAADCARKAAPYVHPQLSSVEHKVNAEFESAVLTLDEAARQVAGLDEEEEGPDPLH